MMDQPPLPPFTFTWKSVDASASALLWSGFLFRWGDLRLSSDAARYTPRDKTLQAEGAVVAVLGTERVTGKDLKITGLDLVTRSLDKKGFGFYFTQAKFFSPVLYLDAKELQFSTETGAEARELRFVPGPEPRGEIELSAGRVRSQAGTGRLYFENATVRLLGNRLLTLQRLAITPRYDRQGQTQSLELPLLYRTSRVSGVAAGVRLPFTPVGGIQGTLLVESTSRQGWNTLITARKELLGAPTTTEPEAPSLFTGLRNATQQERSFEERVRPFIVARPPTPVELSVRRYGAELSAPKTLDPLPRRSGPGLTLEAALESNREFVRRNGFLLRSRLPELRLIGRLPGPRGAGGWLASVGGGPARERRLDGSDKQVRSERLVAALGWEAPRVALGRQGQVHAFVGQTEQYYSHAHYSISELRLAADYGLSPQTGLSGGLALRRAQGQSPFLFDTLEAVNEAQLRGQTQLGSLTLALLGRWDLPRYQLFDTEVALGWRGKTVEPRLTWRSQNQQIGFTVSLPALAGL
jgi:hypothetical protein